MAQEIVMKLNSEERRFGKERSMLKNPRTSNDCMTEYSASRREWLGEHVLFVVTVQSEELCA